MLRLLKGGQSLLNSQQSLLNSQRSAEGARFRTNSNHFNRDRVELSQIQPYVQSRKADGQSYGGDAALRAAHQSLFRPGSDDGSDGDSYRVTAAQRVIAQFSAAENVYSPHVNRLKTAKRRLALGLAVRAQRGDCGTENQHRIFVLEADPRQDAEPDP